MHWYNGELLTADTIALSQTDPGLLYGATVFTTLRVYGQHLDQWQAHCQRLNDSLKAFHWQSPNWEQVRKGATLLARSYSVIRITLFPDGREWITGRSLPPDLKQRQEQGIRAWLADDRSFSRHLPEHKTGNYLGSWLALQRAKEKGAQEAILVDEMGNWLETSTGNLWGWKDGCWWTPVVDQALSGIARSRLLFFLRQQKIPVQETVWTPDFVKTLEGLGYSNCVVEVIPIHTVI